MHAPPHVCTARARVHLHARTRARTHTHAVMACARARPGSAPPSRETWSPIRCPHTSCVYLPPHCFPAVSRVQVLLHVTVLNLSVCISFSPSRVQVLLYVTVMYFERRLKQVRMRVHTQQGEDARISAEGESLAACGAEPFLAFLYAPSQPGLLPTAPSMMHMRASPRACMRPSARLCMSMACQQTRPKQPTTPRCPAGARRDDGASSGAPPIP